jgi:hypothetical protein
LKSGCQNKKGKISKFKKDIEAFVKQNGEGLTEIDKELNSKE